MEERNVMVLNPHGVSWMARFKTEDAAWARLVALKRLPNNEESRKLLREQGWKVIES